MNLSYFSQKDFYNSLKQFFSDLRIPINPVTEAPDSADSILSDTYNANNPSHKLMDDVYFVGMVSEEAFTKQREIKYTAAAKDIKTKDYDCMLLFGVTLKAGRTPSRSQLAEITRAFNRQFSYYPVVVIFKYGESIAFANCERLAYKQAWRAGEKAGKVSLLKDIAFSSPHTGHLKILQTLEIARSGNKAITTFAGLYKYWQEVFSVSVLNKSFYQELSNWYFWALSEISFPDDSEKNDEVRTAENSIRLITRLIFVWFLKEKGLVPDELFDKYEVDKLLDYRKDKTGSAYYRAILQNLFFATLNVPMDEREFRDEKRDMKGRNDDYMNHRVYRYADLFKKANSFEALFGEIPFLNGGLFDCLDHRDENGKVIRIDCYSDNPKNAARLTVPDKLFFGSDVVDLSGIYDDKKKKEVPVRGIIDILNSYKFTIAENTPVEEEIALDPELLGRVFENLLASYNPETQTTARKQTGSFYTPREIVNYMVDESLKAYLATTLGDDEDTKTMLDQVLDYGDDLPELSEKQLQQIIAALEDAKILDPACGSGAFPMGILQKMVRVLEKLDPKNERWKQALIKRTPIEARKEMETILAGNTADYSRKLGIIQNCIYGVDIQPIAIQVSKLRFFISLLVDFSVDKSKHNFGIQPLPNLDYKLMQGNSLIEDFHGFTLNLKEQDTDDNSGHLFSENSKVVSLIEDLWEKQADYLRESRPKQKEKLWEEVENDIVNIFDTYIRQKKAPYFAELKKNVEMTKTIPNEKTREEYLKAEKVKLDKKYNFDYVAVEKELKYFTHGIKPRNFFPWQLYFADVFKKKGGFDVVIGNPPYVRADANTEMLAQRQRIIETKRYKTLYEKWDLFIPFIELSFTLLRDNGITSMIVSDAYCHAKYARKSQEWFLQNSRILRLDFLSKIKVFDAGVHNIIYFYQNADGAENKPERRVHADEFGNVIQLPTNDQRELTHRAFFPESEATQAHLCNTLKIEDICYISKGMVVNADEKEAKGAFELHDLLSDIRDETHPKSFVEGKDVAKWRPIKTKWIEWGTSRAPRLFSRQTFSELYEQSEKLLLVKVGEVRVAYDDASLYTNEGIYVGVLWHALAGVRNNSLKKTARYLGETPPRPDLPKREELEATSRRFAVKFLLGVMNSSCARDFLRANRRNNVQLYPDDWKQLPIPDVSLERQAPIVELVDKILTAKLSNRNADITVLESEVDRLVCALYNLTDDEIVVVEGRA